MFEFSRMIREIDAELRPEWQPGAFRWADEHMGTTHADAIDRFERAIVACSPRCDWVSLNLEAQVYRDAILKILRAYKVSKGIDEQASFLEALRGA